MNEDFKARFSELAQKSADIARQQNDLKEEVRRSIQEQIDMFGFTAKDFRFAQTSSPETAGVRKIDPKYRGPAGELWTGRGVKPRWVREALDAGEDIELYRIRSDE